MNEPFYWVQVWLIAKRTWVQLSFMIGFDWLCRELKTQWSTCRASHRSRAKSQILQVLQSQIPRKNGLIIPGNLQANFAEKRSVKRQPILWQFSKHISLESVWFCIDLTNIFQIKKMTILPIWATCLDHNTCKLCVCITTRFIFDIDHHLLMTTVSIPSFATLIKERLW